MCTDAPFQNQIDEGRPVMECCSAVIVHGHTCNARPRTQTRAATICTYNAWNARSCVISLPILRTEGLRFLRKGGIAQLELRVIS